MAMAMYKNLKINKEKPERIMKIRAQNKEKNENEENDRK